MPKTVKAIIVDDEKLARQRLRMLLVDRTDILVLKECITGSDAVQSITKLKPDLVFLDVEMPELNGLEVVDAIGVDAMPVVVFVTAYDHYAVKAFDIHAIDYLLKPFDRERFQKAVDRALSEVHRRQGGTSQKRVSALLDQMRREDKVIRRLLVKSGSRTTVLNIGDINWIESAGNYVKVHVGKKSHVLRETMGGIQERLDPRQFVRIHRTAIVNVDQVREIRPHFQGNAVVVLGDGQQLPLSRTYQDDLEAALQHL